MKILIIPNRGRSFAAVRPEAECYIDFAEAGHDVTLMLTEDNAYYEKYKASKVKLVLLKSRRKHSLAVITQIHRYIKDNSIDIMYATESIGIVNSVFGCIGTKAKMIVYRGTTRGMYRSDLNNYLCTLHPRVDGFVCLSIAVQDNIKKKVRKSLIPSLVHIYKGHDLAWYDMPATKLESIGAHSEKFNIIALGSHRKSKDMQSMLDVMVHLKDIEDINLLLVGNGFEDEQYQSKIRTTGISERIIQPGFRSDIPQLAASCELSLLTSLEEGLSRFLLESIACGTPAIITDCGGPAEFIEDNYNGYVASVGDSKAIADKIRYLYENRDELKRLSNNAPKTIENKMAHSRTVEKMLDYFTTMIEK